MILWKGASGPRIYWNLAVALEQAGVDALCVNVGWHEAQVPQIVTKVPRGVFAYLARDMKKRVSVPVIASHRINDPKIARLLIARNFCDMVAIGRALITDPWFPEKARTGREKEIVHCVACGQGCFDNLFKMKSVECLCNPRAGHEHEERTGKDKYSQESDGRWRRSGGNVRCHCCRGTGPQGESVRKRTASWRTVAFGWCLSRTWGISWFSVRILPVSWPLHDIRVLLNSPVDKKTLQRESPDYLILATGGEPITPPISGVGRK